LSPQENRIPFQPAILFPEEIGRIAESPDSQTEFPQQELEKRPGNGNEFQETPAPD
jgi:hypothetical protein